MDRQRVMVYRLVSSSGEILEETVVLCSSEGGSELSEDLKDIHGIDDATGENDEGQSLHSSFLELYLDADDWRNGERAPYDIDTRQAGVEESVAAAVFNTYQGCELNEGDAAAVGRDALEKVVRGLSLSDFAYLKEVIR